MNEWVQRALISAAASAVSTTAWVVSAERPGQEGKGPFRRRKKRRKKKKKRGDADERSAPDRQKERMAKKKDADDGGTVAAEDMRNYQEGMTGEEFTDKVKALSAGAKSALTGLFSKDKEEVVVEQRSDADEGDEGRGEKKRSDSKKGSKKKKRRSREKQKDGLSQLKEEALYMATSAVKKKVVQSTGLDKAVDAIKDGAESIKEKSGELGQKVKDAIPDDLGEKVSSAAGDVVESSKRLGSRIKEELDDTEELRDKVGDGLSGLGRWVQGPGAQDYRDEKPLEQRTEELPPARGDVVEAKMGDDELPKDLPR